MITQIWLKKNFVAKIPIIVGEGSKEVGIAKADTSALTHVLIYLYPGNPVTW